MSDALMTRAARQVLGDNAPDQGIAAWNSTLGGRITSFTLVSGEVFPLTAEEGIAVAEAWQRLAAEDATHGPPEGQPIAAVNAGIGTVSHGLAAPVDIAVLRIERRMEATGAEILIEVTCPAADGRRPNLEDAMHKAMADLVAQFGTAEVGDA